MPHIYVSEWAAGRFDCGCIYKLNIKLCKGESVDDKNLQSDDTVEIPPLVPLLDRSKNLVIKQWQGKAWEKVSCH